MYAEPMEHKSSLKLAHLVLAVVILHLVESKPSVPQDNKFFSSTVKTNRPIIGIVAEDSPPQLAKFGRSYIVASYIKYIESAGGRVVPINNNLSEDELEKLFLSINGVLFPGGGVNITAHSPSSGYLRTGEILFRLAKKANDQGDVFPLWGTCLGFQLLHELAARGKYVLSPVHGEDYSIPLNFSKDFQISRLFGSAPREIITYLSTLNVTYNHHRECVTPETYNKVKELKSFFRILSTNRDKQGKMEFISTVEAYNYPFYGSQWHPEKNIFEWTRNESINHSKEAVLIAQYVANSFVDQARLSGHRFSSDKKEAEALIYNHVPTYCMPESNYELCYFFS